uniref:protein SEMI-ROLLED LEAF 2-like isoform X2 n=1 Tax=Erigeron canadensis TaxID=72917 RepID=UPI001CB9A852|nr:protein SEMI-ROLLED LEAF 2-like isoform X2 [Erigeron canadensis]
MGVISRQVLPVCDVLCACCPSLRTRSRHPVKRYKKLLADIFPRSQGGEPNERKIGKLCEYAAKNPLRIPKITDYLEQKFYRNLRNENIGAVKVVLLVYGKLLSSCKKQMPLFASSFLGITGTLLVQSQKHEMQILGCNALVNFINNQLDGAYLFNLEGLIPKLCQLAEEVGNDERVLRLRSAALEVLAFMVRFMGEQPHASMDFENIISVTLENYTDIQPKQEHKKYDRQLSQAHVHAPSFADLRQTTEIVNCKPQVDPPEDAHKNPSYWARVCLHNMAISAKGVTNVRHVLEPIFQKFDKDKLWLPDKGLAFSVLKYLLTILEETDDRSHILFAILIKHLDNKDVTKHPILQLHIVNVATQLSENIKQHDSVTIFGAIADLIKQLRKCLQRLSEPSSPTEGSDSCYTDLQCALENCISNLSCKVGDVGPILDTMAVVLEKIPISAALARANIFAVYRTAQVTTSIPNKTYFRKAFPAALFHHLLLAMLHPDHETRVLAHRVFSIVLIPSLKQTWSIHDLIPSQAEIPSMMPQTVADGSNKSILETIDEDTKEKEDHVMEEHLQPTTESLSCSGIEASIRDRKTVPSSMRLSGHQVSLVLSSIWIQATSMENAPANFEAMANTYTLALSFTLSKASNHTALLRFFQLAFSLRNIALYQQGGPKPSRRRPVFMLASYMIIVTAKAFHIPELISLVRSTMTEETVDPYLLLDEDIRLQAVCTEPGDKNCYVSQADEASAMKSLSAIEIKDQQLKDTLSTHFVHDIGKSSEEDLSNMKAQLSQWFTPDEEYPLGTPLFMGIVHPCSPELQAFEEVMPDADSENEDTCDQYGNQSDGKTSRSRNSLDILSASQLMESVVETARQVENLPDSSTLLTYDQMKNQCEALVTGKQKKMSVLQSFKEQQEAMTLKSSAEIEQHTQPISNNKMEITEVEGKPFKSDPAQGHDQVVTCMNEYGKQESFRLPALSPYDKFLKGTRFTGFVG